VHIAIHDIRKAFVGTVNGWLFVVIISQRFCDNNGFVNVIERNFLGLLIFL
jgi:hypothetical protein